MILRLGLAVVLLGLNACGGKDASSLTHPPRRHSYPLYVTVPGAAAGSGKIVKFASPGSLDGKSEPVDILTGLDFPAGIAVETDGTLYFTVRPSPTTGKIMKFKEGDLAPEELNTGLHNPEGLALDRASRLYVSEGGRGVLSERVSAEELLPVRENLAWPRSVATDENDNLYVAEYGAGTASKVIPDGTVESLGTEMSNLMMVGPGLVGNVFMLANNTGFGDGVAYQKTKAGSTETYLSSLINPKSFAWEDGTILYVAEGAPANRIMKYSRVTGIRVVVGSIGGDPHSMAFTPLD